MESLSPRVPCPRARLYGPAPRARTEREEELVGWLEAHRFRPIPVGVGLYHVAGRIGALVYHDADGHLVVEAADRYHFPRDLEGLGRVLRALAW